VTRLVLLKTSPRVPPGLLSAQAWQLLSQGPVYAADPTSSTAQAVAAAGLPVLSASVDHLPEETARLLVESARSRGCATWLLAATGDEPLVAALDELAERAGGVTVELVQGSWDLPGARLLDVVATMDRLRSPGGCPWDAQQDHESLAPYLLEEAYEAFQAVEDADSSALREELGDVLLQVAFHARLAEERPEDGWSIDDVAGGLVDKLVRRHPHVFGGVAVDGVEHVNENWELIKAAERGEVSALASVPLAAPALTLATTLQRKAERAGLSTPVSDPDKTLAHALEAFRQAPTAETAGTLLWEVVATARAAGVDPEAALRARAREFRDRVSRRGAE
jgi:XTP/dITP diphosphohydrolase